MARSININYPFKESSKGDYVQLNSDDASAIKSDLLHLIITKKGQRLYNPDFGTDLLKFIFEPNDSLTLANLKAEITQSAKKYLPNVQIDSVSVYASIESEYVASVTISYTITDDAFSIVDTVTVNI